MHEYRFWGTVLLEDGTKVYREFVFMANSFVDARREMTAQLLITHPV